MNIEKELKFLTTMVQQTGAVRDCFESIKNIKDFLESQQKTIEDMQWISVNDRLPETGSFLLQIKEEQHSWTQQGGYSKVFSSGAYWYVEDEHCNEVDLREHESVTHWMPLPKPPLKQ